MKELSRKQLLAELKKRDEKIAGLEQELSLMRQKMDLLIRRMFGKSNEKLSADQLDLFLQTSEEPASGKECASLLEEATRAKESRPRQAGRGRENWPDNLPVVEEIVDPQEVVQSPEDWRLIGAEVSEQLDYEPGRFFRRRVVRRKYVERGNTEAVPVIAPLAPVLQERSMADPVSWLLSSWANTLITFPFTGRNRSSPIGMESRSRVRTWYAGWNSQLTG